MGELRLSFFVAYDTLTLMYTTQANVEARLGRSLTTSEASYFTSVLSGAIDAQINALTGTLFGSTTVVDVIVDPPVDSDTIVIPTMHNVTAVTYVDNEGNNTVVSVSDYFTYPRGAADVYAIKKLNSQWNSPDMGYYKITGKLGYTTIPADLIAVATEMAFNTLNVRVGNVKSEKVGDWAVTYGDMVSLSTDSQDTIQRYQRLSRRI